MRNLNETNVTDAVLGLLEGTRDPRLKQILTALIEHLHGFVREVEPTEEEWRRAIDDLTRIGKLCDDSRQEFILLSDVLGVTMLVDAINHRKSGGATESSVLGPFYRENAQFIEPMETIDRGGGGEPVIVRGRVATAAGEPIAGALLDIWQSAPNGLYENQDPNQCDMNLRGRLTTDSTGRYEFCSVKPASYPIPDDGPVGRMLRETGRHNFRPAHIHFTVSAKGFEPVTTMLFVEGDPYLDSDPVFGVKESLVVDFIRHDAPSEAEAHGLTPPFYMADYDFGLRPNS